MWSLFNLPPYKCYVGLNRVRNIYQDIDNAIEASCLLSKFNFGELGNLLIRMAKLTNILVYFLKSSRVNEITLGTLFGSWVLIVLFFESPNCDGAGHGDKSR